VSADELDLVPLDGAGGDLESALDDDDVVGSETAGTGEAAEDHTVMVDRDGLADHTVMVDRDVPVDHTVMVDRTVVGGVTALDGTVVVGDGTALDDDGTVVRARGGGPSALAEPRLLPSPRRAARRAAEKAAEAQGPALLPPPGVDLDAILAAAAVVVPDSRYAPRSVPDPPPASPALETPPALRTTASRMPSVARRSRRAARAALAAWVLVSLACVVGAVLLVRLLVTG
jgi:hypothetical protein